MARLPIVTDDPQVLFAIRRLQAANTRIADMGEELSATDQYQYGAITTVMGEFLSRASGMLAGAPQSIDDIYKMMVRESAMTPVHDALYRGTRRLDFTTAETTVPLHDDFVLVLNDLINTRNGVTSGAIANDYAAFDKACVFATQLGLDTSAFDKSEGLAEFLREHEGEVIISPTGPDSFKEEVGEEFAQTLHGLQEMFFDKNLPDPTEANALRNFGLAAFDEVQKRLADGHTMPPARLRMALLAGGTDSSLVQGLSEPDQPITKAIASIAAAEPSKAARMASLASQILKTGYAI